MATPLQDMHPQTRQNLWLKISKKSWPKFTFAWVAFALGACLAGCNSRGQASFTELPDVGKRTLAKFEIPVEVVAAIAARNNKPDTGITASWTSPEITLQESAGPFMAVLSWDGKAQAAGARAQYTLSWLGIQSQKLKGDSLDHFVAFGHYGESKDAYPLNVHKAASSQPFRIEQNQKVTVSLLPNEIKGLVPTRMTLEVRAGIGGGMENWRVMLQWMLPGLVMVFVWWWLFKRER